MDLVEALAVPIPMYVIAEMLGVSRSDRSDFKRWSDAMIEAGGGGRTAATDAAVGEMLGYFQGVLGERRRAPKDDLSRLWLAPKSKAPTSQTPRS